MSTCFACGHTCTPMDPCPCCVANPVVRTVTTTTGNAPPVSHGPYGKDGPNQADIDGGLVMGPPDA